MTQSNISNSSTADTPVAFITGAARRVGAHIAKNLHEKGFNIIIHCHNSLGDAEQLATTLNHARPQSVVVCQGNLNCDNDIQNIATFVRNAWQRLDILVNNASSFYPTPFGLVTSTQWDDLFASNLRAPFFLSQHLYELLKEQKGSIINISDIFAEKPRKDYSAYCIAKAGNNMLTQMLALELAPDVRVNGIAPGAILWPEDENGNEMINPEALQKIPLGALGGSRSIADAVTYFIQPDNYVTGQVLRVDGGRSLHQ